MAGARGFIAGRPREGRGGIRNAKSGVQRRGNVDRRRHRCRVRPWRNPFEGANFRDLVRRLRGRPLSRDAFELVTSTREDGLNIHLLRPGRSPSLNLSVLREHLRHPRRRCPSLPFFTLRKHTARYIRVRSLLAITPAQLQIASPPHPLVALMPRHVRAHTREQRGHGSEKAAAADYFARACARGDDRLPPNAITRPSPIIISFLQ